MSDTDDQDWLEGLTGGRAPVDPALQREIAAVRRAVARLDAAAASQQDDVGRARLLKRLEQENLLPVPASPKRWAPWLAAAATVAFAAIAFQVLKPTGSSPAPDVPVETPRGVAGAIRLAVSDPEATAIALREELRALGFEAVRSPRTDRVILEVDVAADRTADFRSWAERRGGRVTEPGRYRILIDSTQPDEPAHPTSP